ncbi:MAG: hypothetical protein P4L36_15500 [Holophaga sp.]|nr:hypothetical protein [Holophaga sp.]
MTPDPWLVYRQKRRRLAWIALAGLALLGLSILPARARHSGKPILGALVLFLGGTLWAATSLSAFPCPHCGKPFTHDGETRDDFSGECVHCHQPKWSSPK